MRNRRPARRKTTALARITRTPATRATPAKPVKIAAPPAAVAPTPDVAPLTDEIALGNLGMVELTLTEREETILSERVNEANIRIKPDGMPYLSHPAYTQWFNRAFGRLGWALRMVAKPMLNAQSVVCPYVLYVHGHPVAFAMGEQEYFASNKNQTYGDALEATVASALRRVAKHLGVSLELWDKRYVEAFKAKYGVRVKREGESHGMKKVRWEWRLRTDPPFYDETSSHAPARRNSSADVVNTGDTFEVSEVYQEHPETCAAPAPSAPAPSAQGEPITQKQRQRLWMIVKNSGRTEGEIRAWLQHRYGLTSTKDITKPIYEAVCAAIESRAEVLR